MIKKLCPIFFFLIVSCTITQDMWNQHYDEDFKRFLISQDGQKIVFLSEKYHYILDDDTGIVKKILFSPHRRLLLIDTENSYLKLDRNNNINANIAIKVTTLNPPRDAAIFFQSLGFYTNPSTRQLFLKMKLLGKRYLAPHNISTYALTLNNNYNVEVRYHLNDSDKMRKAALTPITMTVDAVLLIGKVILLPFGN